ncbi:threonine synthase [Halomarina litorea]|uniref:threonine synthase n=1 Tax=Halomarina litorea TaxID=2961595 RepID=UPI0020C3EB84|nr:threonine synthase [Halomarina sp. BCD28]
MNQTTRRTCYACGATHDTTAARCDCGEPLWIATPTDGFWDDWPAGGPDSMWRYRDLLAVDPPTGLAGAAGGTPLVRTPPLDHGGVRVHVKYEGANPTGSFKDRGSAVGVAAALDDGAPAVGTVSHGNMARSVAAHAASTSTPAVVLVPADIPESRLAPIARYGPTVLRVDGDYGRLYDRSLELGADLGVPFLNSDVPLRVEGQKTLAYEVCETFAPEVPDAVILPVSSGGNASAVWKGLRDLEGAGRIDRLPRLYFVQTAACAPIAEAFDRGDDAVERVERVGETIAYSIANADPPSGTRALAAARDTGGAVLAVDDDAIRTAQRRLAREAGLAVEPAGATPLAALSQLRETGNVEEGEDVVLVGTGTEVAGGEVAPEDVAIVGMDGLRERVEDLLASE